MSVVSRGNQAINERYRPLRFSELVGNESTKIKLKRWMERGDKRSRAILLSGVSSGGKTTTARILAMGLNCEQGDTIEPCLECASCQASLKNVAFHIIEHNMAEANTKEDAEAIVNSMQDFCITGRNKVYILDEVQKLTSSSQNLFLKAVEKPPANVYVIFCTTDAGALIAPLRNRCEQYTYTLPTDQDISSLLGDVVRQEGLVLTDQQKIDFFRFAKGKSYREILFALEQYSAGLSINDLVSISSKNKVDLFDVAKRIIYKGEFDAWVKAVASGENLEFETFRCMLRTMAEKALLRAGLKNLTEGALYYDILSNIEQKRFIEPNSSPSATALVWRICEHIMEYKESR